MKISAKQYAQGLYDLVAGKSEDDVAKVLRSFVGILARDRELNKEREIIDAFSEIWNKEDKELVANVTTPRELTGESRNTIIEYLKKRTSSDKVALNENIDESLLGGFILKYESRILDGSLKTNLADLKVNLEK